MAAEIVAVEPASPPEEPRREILPGVAEKTSLRLWVGFRLDNPPVFSTSVRPWTAPLRELGFSGVRLFAGVKRLPLIKGRVEATEDEPGRVRQYCRSLRSSLAAGLLLPGYHTATHVDQLWEGTAPGFEVSRRIIEFEDDGSTFRLICHVFAPRRAEITERLLLEFIEEFSAKQAESAFCDAGSRLCFFGRSSIRLPRRQYWEIVIGQPERLIDVPASHDFALTETMDLDVGQTALDERTVGNMDTSEESDHIGSALADSATVTEINARSALDWDFMASEIARAVAEGVALDEDFVENLALRRLEYARTALAGEEPGPTLESSRRIASEVVAIHSLALEAKEDAT